MSSNGLRTRAWRTAVIAAALALAPAALEAQTGRITGAVRDGAGQPIADAQVSVAGSAIVTRSAADGRFALAAVPVGTHQVRVVRLGYVGALVRDVVVRDGEEARIDVALNPAPAAMSAVVISASRRAEKITDAPATISKIGLGAIENSAGSSFTAVMKQVQGIDFVQVGVTSAAVNARGFNSSFNNRMLMMEDGRLAVLPENGLPVGQFTAIPKIDLAGVEVIVGPGAALYGADASNGVITLTSKDPKEFPGTSFEVAGGSRNYIDVQGRQAGVLYGGKLGYKLTGEYQSVDDFENYLTYALGSTRVPEIGIDWQNRVLRGQGALVWYRTDAQRLELTYGMSSTDGVGQTNVGRNQLDGWTYSHAQAKWTSPRWYANAYRTNSKAGDSYAINRYSTNRVLQPSTVSDDSVKKLSDWPSDGQLYAAELQNNFELPQLFNTRIVWGGQYRQDIVSSDREWLTDRLTGEDLEIAQYGAYLQTETQIIPKVSLILAGRYDGHDNYDSQFSPKAGLVWKPAEDRSVRLTFNRAFKAPTTLQTNFYIPNFAPIPSLGIGVGVFGNRDGFTVRDSAGTTVLRTITGMQPEENTTWEVGYRGPIGSAGFFLDATAYYADYENFLGSLLPINTPHIPGARTYVYDHTGTKLPAFDGLEQWVFTYQNLGAARIFGTDIGWQLAATPKTTVSGTVSWLRLSSVEESARDRQATALNAPTFKWTAGAEFADVWYRLSGGFRIRHVTGYQFTSGINVGKIPTFQTLDVNVSYPLPMRLVEGSARVNLAVANLFSCRSRYTNQYGMPTTQTRTLCGFDERHQEMVNMPGIGTTIFLGLRYDR